MLSQTVFIYILERKLGLRQTGDRRQTGVVNPISHTMAARIAPSPIPATLNWISERMDGWMDCCLEALAHHNCVKISL